MWYCPGGVLHAPPSSPRAFFLCQAFVLTSLGNLQVGNMAFCPYSRGAGSISAAYLMLVAALLSPRTPTHIWCAL